MEACFILLVVLTSTVFGARLPSRIDHAPLILPVNEFHSTSSAGDTTVLPDPDVFNNDIAWPESFTTPNSSSSLVNATGSTLGAPQYSCNGKAYGKNLNVASCVVALGFMPDGKKAIKFGERNQGEWDANLPFRVLSPDGLCAIDIAHKAGVNWDNAAPTDLKLNAAGLIDLCVKTKPNEGGVARNLGEHGNLAIRVTPYRPRVLCRAHGPPPADCRTVLDFMPADGKKQLFGGKNDPNPEITSRLPTEYHSWRKRCQVYVDTLPRVEADTYDWYKLWAAAIAIEFMCGHRGYSGITTGLGDQKTLFLELRDLAAPDLPPGLAVS